MTHHDRLVAHWKQRATQCAYHGNDTAGAQCERTRKKGWTTCPRHYSAGRTLSGLKLGQPRLKD